MNLDKDQNTDSVQSRTCPVTHLPIIQRPEWVYENPDSDYRVEISVLGDRIVLSQPSGYADRKDVKIAMSLIDRVVCESISVDKTYIAIRLWYRCLQKLSFLLSPSRFGYVGAARFQASFWQS